MGKEELRRQGTTGSPSDLVDSEGFLLTGSTSQDHRRSQRMIQHQAAPQRPPPSTAPSETAQHTGEKTNDFMSDYGAKLSLLVASCLTLGSAVVGTARVCLISRVMDYYGIKTTDKNLVNTTFA